VSNPEQRKKGVDDTTAAWAAGIIDTAGRFSVTITPEGRYDVDLNVAMPSLSTYEQIKVLVRLTSLFSGRISGTHTEGYTWRLPGHTLRAVLPSFGRYITLQSDQVSIASDLFQRTEMEREDDFEMTPEELDARADLHFAMDTANRRRYGG
jgi:hypothetical protein